MIPSSGCPPWPPDHPRTCPRAGSSYTTPRGTTRRRFTRLLDRLEPGDVLVVTKLDRLGRNVMDVGSTVARLAELEVRVHCLALGGVDLTSSTGKLTMNVLNAVAEFERDLLVERTQAGLSRAKAEGKTLGRPLSLTEDQRRAVERDEIARCVGSDRVQDRGTPPRAAAYGRSRSALWPWLPRWLCEDPGAL